MTRRLTVALYSARTPNDPEWFWRNWEQWAVSSGGTDENWYQAERNLYWIKPYQELKSRLSVYGVDLRLMSEFDCTKPDVVWFIGLPNRPAVVHEIVARWPHARRVLHVVESPAVAPHEHEPANYSTFDSVITFRSRDELYPQFCLEGVDVLTCPLPFFWANQKHAGDEALSFSDRRLGAVAAQNSLYGAFGNFSGFRLKKSLGGRSKPEKWNSSLVHWLDVQKGISCFARSRLVKCFDEVLDADEFDIFGNGWSKQAHPRLSLSRWLLYKSPNALGHLAVPFQKIIGRYRFALTCENWIGSWGYVSEKAFMAFSAGTVPIYLGDTAPPFPREAFIDARRYPSPESMVSAVKSIGPETWSEMSRAGINFARNEIPRIRERFFEAAKQVIGLA